MASEPKGLRRRPRCVELWQKGVQDPPCGLRYTRTGEAGELRVRSKGEDDLFVKAEGLEPKQGQQSLGSMQRELQG